MESFKKTYILITPAKNEEAYIEKTIQSVLAQTIPPKAWVIVSDGSTDQTDEIVKSYLDKNKFIHFLQLPKREGRDFAAKVNAINKGFEILSQCDFEYYGNLDADVSFEPDYYEQLLIKFQQDPLLGITGGQLYDFFNGSYHRLYYGLTSVAGPIQFFRFKCYQQIGGYTPYREGLVDAIAEVTARMHGWRTRTFSELKVFHYRKTGSEGKNIWASTLREGKMDYMFGLHPLFHLLRSLQRSINQPYILGSVLRTCSYFWYSFKKPERPVSSDFVSYLRSEEMQKLKDLLHGKLDF